MSLLDRFRTRPRWEHPDPEVRAEAVRQDIPATDQPLLTQLARGDADARVRRAALRKLIDAEVLGAALGDADLGVREEAAEALLNQAMGQDLAAAETALSRLTEPRHLATLARSARLAPIRLTALTRLSDVRGLAILARTAADPAVRLAAIKRVEEPALLLEIATKSDHKDVVIVAVDRLADPTALESVAVRARSRAASRRAQARLATLRPSAVAPLEDAVVPPPAQTPEPALAETVSSVAPVPATEDEPAPAETVERPAEPSSDSISATQGFATAVPAEAEPVEAVGASSSSDGPAPSPIATSVEQETAHPPKHPPQTADERARREAERQHTFARIESFCARLEDLVKTEGLALKDATAGLRDAKDIQSLLSGLPGKVVQRFKVARAALYAKTQELREADEWSRWSNATVQEELCRAMESLAGREDLDKVASELRDADARWASARYAPRDQAETLRQRYQTARVLVKTRLNAYFAKKASEESENLRQKEALCERAEALSDSTEWIKAAEELKSLQARWKQIGPVPQRRSQAVWKRFRAACDHFFTRRDADLRQRKQAWAANLARKEELCAQAEAQAQSSDWDAASVAVRRLQSEWKTIGPVQRHKSDAVWKRFRTACDAFFERYKRRDALAEEAKRAEREAVVVELEGLSPAIPENEAPERLCDKVLALQARFRQMPPLSGPDEEALSQRLIAARNRLIDTYPERFRGTDLDPETSRTRKEKLCARIEVLAADAAAEATPTDGLSGEELARRLKEALATRTMGGGADIQARKRAAVEEVDAARAAWKRLGPVPGEVGRELERRFEEACTRFFAQKRDSGGRRSRPQTVTGTA